MSGKLYFKKDNGEYCPLCDVTAMPEYQEKINDAIFKSISSISHELSFTANLGVADDFKHTLDLLCRPCIVYCHPDDEDKFKECKKIAIIRPTMAVEKGKCYVMDRKVLEESFIKVVSE